MTHRRKDKTLKFLQALAGQSFRFTRWQKPNPEWTHDHCRGCTAHICDEDDNDFHEAYVTVDKNGDESWVCPNCFEMWHLVLNFKVKNLQRTNN
jgi:hypothetical protein